MIRRSLAAALAAVCAAPAFIAPAWAAWPERPMRLIVGVAPGGPADASARMIAERVGEHLKQPMVVENRPGSNNAIAIQYVLSQPADGYTVMLGTTGAMTISPAVLKTLAYDPLRDLIPVGSVVGYSYLLVVRNGIPATTIVEHAKWNPNKLSFTSPGIASVNHMGMEHFSMLTGIKMTHIPYKGDSEAMADILGGHVDCGFVSFSLTAPQAKAGKLRALAISQPDRTVGTSGTIALRTAARSCPTCRRCARRGCPGSICCPGRG